MMQIQKPSILEANHQIKFFILWKVVRVCTNPIACEALKPKFSFLILENWTKNVDEIEPRFRPNLQTQFFFAFFSRNFGQPVWNVPGEERDNDPLLDQVPIILIQKKLDRFTNLIKMFCSLEWSSFLDPCVGDFDSLARSCLDARQPRRNTSCSWPATSASRSSRGTRTTQGSREG